MSHIAVALCLLIGLPVGAMAAEDQNNEDFVLSEGRVGDIRVGMSIDDLFRKYDRTATNLVDLQLEGRFSPAVEMLLHDSQQSGASAVVEVGWNPRRGWIVSRARVYDGRFKTVRGIGAGSTLGDVREHYKVDWIDYGEGALFARVEELGMSLALKVVWNEIPSQWRETHDQSLIPDSVSVKWILVTAKPTANR